MSSAQPISPRWARIACEVPCRRKPWDRRGAGREGGGIQHNQLLPGAYIFPTQSTAAAVLDAMGERGLLLGVLGGEGRGWLR